MYGDVTQSNTRLPVFYSNLIQHRPQTIPNTGGGARAAAGRGSQRLPCPDVGPRPGSRRAGGSGVGVSAPFVNAFVLPAGVMRGSASDTKTARRTCL